MNDKSRTRGGLAKRQHRAAAAPQEPDAEQPLSRERIGAVAVELLDQHGVERMTMRLLADKLKCGVMSLYWHVAKKDDVLDLALDSVLAYEGPSLGRSQDWRRSVLLVLEDWRAAMLRHPWSAPLLPRRTLGPSILGRLELLASALSSAGVSDAELNPAIWSLWNYVMGATITRASFGLTEEEMADGQARLLEQAKQYPTIERSRLLLDSDWDGAFKSGINFLLDGLLPNQAHAQGRQTPELDKAAEPETSVVDDSPQAAARAMKAALRRKGLG
ncbi:TetR/AcrR family transcriptional regulator [Roseateles sp. NT4]|uniref:TetR/AcrR family transcriptional regulator n=1 Tax=Roseateles sp. NT4 TaxID=3453715 RepID=UPI003EE87379